MQSPDQSILLELVQRLATIEAKLDDIRHIRKAVSSAESKAGEALLLAKQNSDDIANIRSEGGNQKRFILTTVLGVIFSISSMIIALISIF